MKATAIFDIGKTNKKFFLFDSAYQELFKSFIDVEESKDDDGFPCDDLPAIENWIKKNLHAVLQEKKFDIKNLNFASYGASLVHIDKNDKPLTPLYNYLKPIPKEILASFYAKYGDELTLAKETASPPLGMLNSGLQLYWLKCAHPEIFAKIRWSLHLPQYLSFLFTGIPLSDFTSIGCHTFLWDFGKNDYHAWVYAEKFDQILPPVVSPKTSINVQYAGKKLRVGVGIHDSSAALLPYMAAARKPFLLISTGTWSISINPFNQEVLSEADLQEDCLNFMSIEGKAIKAARLFLGNEHNLQVEKLCSYFEKKPDYHTGIRFNPVLYTKLTEAFMPLFRLESIGLNRKQPEKTSLQEFASFEEAYHQLMLELVELQIQSSERAIGKTPISKLFIDGGFAENDIYVHILSRHFREVKIQTTQAPLGSALGAAMLVSNKEVKKGFLKKNYFLKKYKIHLETE